MPHPPLLNPSDPHPVRKIRGKARTSPFLLVGDHAGAAIPGVLGDLGLSEGDRGRHIAIDVGVEGLGQALAGFLDADFISQAYSRLVVDCNRPIDHPELIVQESDGSQIPGNRSLDADERQARLKAIYWPYHDAIAAEIGGPERAGNETVLVSLHSFSPVLAGQRRPWEIGILHDGHRDDFALSLLRLLESRNCCVGDNAPYRMDETDFTVPHHAFRRGLRYVEIEVRQDVLHDDPSGMSRLLAEALPQAL